jgi:hypothetical protein
MVTGGEGDGQPAGRGGKGEGAAGLGQAAALAAEAAAGARQGAHALAGPGEQGLSWLLEKLVQPGILANLRARGEKAAGQWARSTCWLGRCCTAVASCQLYNVHGMCIIKSWHPARLPPASLTCSTR